MISKFLLELHKESTKVMQSNHEEFWNAAKANVYKITDEIYQGAFPTDSTREYLASIGVTSFLNVSGEEIDSSKGQECLSILFRDGQTIPKKCIKQSLEYIDRCIKNGKKVFVHCTAGQNRSPTIVWLYLINKNKSIDIANKIIKGKTLDAMPGHPKLVGKSEVKYALNIILEP